MGRDRVAGWRGTGARRVVVDATGHRAPTALRRMARPDLPACAAGEPRHARWLRTLAGGPACWVPARRGRVLFMLPFFGRTLVGTTELPSRAEAERLAANERHRRLRCSAAFPQDYSDAGEAADWAAAALLLPETGGSGRRHRRVCVEHAELSSCGLISVDGRIIRLRSMASTLSRWCEQLAAPWVACRRSDRRERPRRSSGAEAGRPGTAQQRFFPRGGHLIAAWPGGPPAVLACAAMPASAPPSSDVIPLTGRGGCATWPAMSGPATRRYVLGRRLPGWPLSIRPRAGRLEGTVGV